MNLSLVNVRRPFTSWQFSMVFAAPTFDQLVDFAYHISDRRIRTGSRGRAFEVHANHDRLKFVPESSGNARSATSRKQTEELLRRLEATGSWSPAQYLDLTPNAAYVLALVREYRNDGVVADR